MGPPGQCWRGLAVDEATRSEKPTLTARTSFVTTASLVGTVPIGGFGGLPAFRVSVYAC
jgi:hypothetical protein